MTAPGDGGRSVPATKPFGDLVEEVLSPAFGIASRLTRDRAAAEELVRAAALQAFRSFATLRPGTCFRLWFFAILVGVWRAGPHPHGASSR